MGKNRGLKNRTAISTAIDKDLWARFKQHSDETSIPTSRLLDKAIAMFLESVKSRD